jgi:N-acetyltransferase B complex (NatB) non catalytic subunit
MIAANLLESAIQYSPYNAYLKILAIFVFGCLNAASRSWELFNDLHVKHIQYESLSYLIFPILRCGGMFRETILVGREILGLHHTAAREVADYTGRAMESGAVSKAEEFLLFHREKMSQSLTALDAKGLILDMAPLLVDENDGVLGAEHGIVGADTDFERVKQMITEAHNPNGVFSLLQLESSLADLIVKFSDNRDFSILSYEILWKQPLDSAEVILRESLRRGHQHNLLIRTVLCVEATKGPKKGKVTKSSLELQKRCSSLLQCVDSTETMCSSIVFEEHFVSYLHVMRHLCLAVVALSAGLASSGEFMLETLDTREEVVVAAVVAATESLLRARNNVSEARALSVSEISCLIPDSLVPCFALFQMVAKVADIFGWGRRKRKTKRCAASLSDFALLMTALIDDLLAYLERYVCMYLLSFLLFDLLIVALAVFR